MKSCPPEREARKTLQLRNERLTVLAAECPRSIMQISLDCISRKNL
jgi:hypothetical protein